MTKKNKVPVDVIAQKEVVSVRRVSGLVKVSQEVLELAVDVPGDVDGGLELQQHRLLEKHLADDQTQLANLIFG